MKILYISCLTLSLCAPVLAIDSELYQKYQAYKERQQVTQGQALEQARAALRNGDLDAAQQHLATARNLAYAPEAISALEQEIADEKNRREQARLAEQQQPAAEQSSNASGSASSGSFSSQVWVSVAFGTLSNTPHSLTMRVIDSDGFAQEASGRNHLYVPYIKAGRHTLEVTASRNDDGTYRWSQGFSHSGSGNLKCSFHLFPPSSHVNGECN